MKPRRISAARAGVPACTLAWLLTTALAPASAAAAEQPTTGSALSVLPPEASVRRVLENLPQFRIGTAMMALASAEQAKLQAGPYEWTLRSSLNARSVAGGERYAEQDLALERTLRWFGKAEQDRALGDQGRAVARARHEDLWHEAGRTLMKDWFDALRDLVALERLREQITVARQLRSIAERRVHAGDGAALEQQQAATEVLRTETLLLQAQQRQEQSLGLLTQSYPGLPAPLASDGPLVLPLPQADLQGAEYWYAKILSDNHELELAQGEADLLALRAKRLAADRMPDPTIALRAARERAGEERLIGVTVSIPIPGAGRSADASAAAIRARAAGEQLLQARTRVQSMARRAVLDCTRSYQIWHSLAQIDSQSAQQAQLLLRAYQAGEGTLAEALAARRRALDAAMQTESAQIDALAAFARVRLDAHAIWSID
ncbi:TolC family protein [Massilia sp. PWRC2]|uniref:TolC family protein n=1 Tax=Massilia sp. PWRC2 TaxID=2804626 RepID=UPI003CF2E15B